MRLELQMELLKPEIDIDYRRIIISYLKFALEHCEGGRFFEKFYKNRDNIVKDYCFPSKFSSFPIISRSMVMLYIFNDLSYSY